MNTSRVTGSRDLEVSQMGRGSFETLAAAKAEARPGDTIYVLDGTYDENDLLKDMVNWWFAPGVKVHFLGSGGTEDRAIFDDSGAAVTCRIGGYGEFIFAGDQSTMVVEEGVTGQVVQLLHGSSNVSVEGYRAAAANPVISGPSGSGLFNIRSCSKFFGKFATIESTSSEILTTFYWRAGEAEIEAGEILNGSSAFAVQAQASTATGTRLSIRAGLIRSTGSSAIAIDNVSGVSRVVIRANYVVGTGDAQHFGVLLLRGGASDIEIGRVDCTSGAGRSCGGVECGEGVGGSGNHVVKIGHLVTTLTANNTTGVFVRVSAGVLDLTCARMEGSGNFTGDGFNISAGTFNYHGFGGLVTSGVGSGVSHSGGTTSLQGLRIDTTAQNNAACRPVTVSGAGLRMQDCLLISPAAVLESIHAAAAQTVTLRNVGAVVAKHANVTVNGDAVSVSANYL